MKDDRHMRLIVINGARTVLVPVTLWQYRGTRLMTHKPHHGKFTARVSEETTGLGVPNTFAMSEIDAESLAVSELNKRAGELAAELKKHPRVNP